MQREMKIVKVCALIAPFIGMVDPALGPAVGRIIAFSLVLGMICAWMLATRMNPVKYQPHQFRFYLYAEIWSIMMICLGPTMLKYM
jgi:hypothetical protein